MTTEELLKDLYDKTLVGNGPAVLELTNEGLGMGMGPEMLLYEALIPSLEEVGARFERCMEEAAGLSAVLGYRQRAARHNRKAGAA